MSIFFCSDLHLQHNKEFLYGPRGFDNIREHNETIVKLWNQTVGEEDDVYCLGDVLMNDSAEAMKYFNQLNGRIHIIFGNHDSAQRQELLAAAHNVVEVCGYSTVITYHKQRLYLSHYPTNTYNYDVDKPMKGRVLSLCGHTHQKEKWDKNIPLCYHVELDAHDNKPVEIEEVLEDFRHEIARLQKYQGTGKKAS